jgi:ketosteroid isomerase-like protein
MPGPKKTAAAWLLMAALSLPMATVSANATKPSAATGPGGAATASSPAAPSVDDLREQVRKSEIAFAKTMADRDHKAFGSFLAEEAIFVGPRRVLRGRPAIADGWKSFYEGAKAPFSWAPEKVEVVDSGTLALSSGPVFGPDGKRIGTFNSTWRREGDGSWKVVLDNGCPDCDCEPGKTGKK